VRRVENGRVVWVRGSHSAVAWWIGLAGMVRECLPFQSSFRSFVPSLSWQITGLCYHVEVQHGGRVCLQVLAAAALELGLTTRLDRRPLEANFAVVLQ
jgi:hypothetical protein